MTILDLAQKLQDASHIKPVCLTIHSPSVHAGISPLSCLKLVSGREMLLQSVAGVHLGVLKQGSACVGECLTRFGPGTIAAGREVKCLSDCQLQSQIEQC